ncbi:unnamed protein product [Macrosiphum euphorbiae]|uniref:Uncharacterized protein n=1 Tax=Macrosiphum euphorbiae TaxID=13131 RepID=A0AAV0XTT9_9HEMI|nr:unnamed protein product [Macrosiphum euphorbiae]
MVRKCTIGCSSGHLNSVHVHSKVKTEILNKYASACKPSQVSTACTRASSPRHDYLGECVLRALALPRLALSLAEIFTETISANVYCRHNASSTLSRACLVYEIERGEVRRGASSILSPNRREATIYILVLFSCSYLAVKNGRG